MKEKPFNCVVCGKPWVSFGKPGKYCSNKCKCKAYQAKRKAYVEALESASARLYSSSSPPKVY